MTAGAREHGDADAEGAALPDGRDLADAPRQIDVPDRPGTPHDDARDQSGGPKPSGALAAHHDAVTQPSTAPAARASDEDLVAAQTAVRGFVVSQGLGALLMVYSFTHLYVFGLRPGASVANAFVVAATALVVGSLMWWRSRIYAQRLEMGWGRRWQAAIDLFAYTAMVFWLLFLVALWLTSRGVALF